MSESGQPREVTHTRLQPLTNQNAKPRHHDTSDSTDSESYTKRRRIKTKHELDKMKSNSNSSLLANSTQGSGDTTGNAGTVSKSPPAAKVPNGNIETSKPPKVPGSSSVNLPDNKLPMQNMNVRDLRDSNSSQNVSQLNGSLGFPIDDSANHVPLQGLHTKSVITKPPTAPGITLNGTSSPAGSDANNGRSVELNRQFCLH